MPGSPTPKFDPEAKATTARQLWFTDVAQVQVREQALAPLRGDEVLVQTECSAISAGTEMLLYRGQMPAEMSVDANFEGLESAAAYPLRYGYACVGRIKQGGADVDPGRLGERVFAFQPHASHFIAKAADVISVPLDIEAEAAVFLPTMETAVNLVHDGQPNLGERVVVLGQGVVGLLVAGLLAQFPLQRVLTVDAYPTRRARALELGVDETFDPGNSDSMAELKQRLVAVSRGGDIAGADLIFEVSGVPQALNLAIELSGYASRIVIGSWYGSKSSAIALGGVAHRNRLRLVTSQVSTIAPELVGRWSKQRRFESAWEMIRKLRPQGLISHRATLDYAETLYHKLDSAPDDIVQAVLNYL